MNLLANQKDIQTFVEDEVNNKLGPRNKKHYDYYTAICHIITAPPI